MNEIQFNPQLQPAAELTDEQLAELAQKRDYLQGQANDIIAIAEHQSNSALNCLHRINVLGGTTEKAYSVVQQRILDDQDTHGAYHAIAMAQTTADLPFDVPTLVDLIATKAEPELQLRLIKLFDNQPVTAEPIPRLRQAILDSGDRAIIDKLHTHFSGH